MLMRMESANRSCASSLPHAAPPTTAAVAAAAPMPSTLIWQLIMFPPLIQDQIGTRVVATVETATHMSTAVSRTAATRHQPRRCRHGRLSAPKLQQPSTSRWRDPRHPMQRSVASIAAGTSTSSGSGVTVGPHIFTSIRRVVAGGVIILRHTRSGRALC